MEKQREKIRKLESVLDLIMFAYIRLENLDKSLNDHVADWYPEIRKRWRHQKLICEMAIDRLVKYYQKLSEGL